MCWQAVTTPFLGPDLRRGTLARASVGEASQMLAFSGDYAWPASEKLVCSQHGLSQLLEAFVALV